MSDTGIGEHVTGDVCCCCRELEGLTISKFGGLLETCLFGAVYDFIVTLEYWTCPLIGLGRPMLESNSMEQCTF